MIPIENSIAGRVADIHHFLPNSGLHIVGEYFLPIHFQLMAPRGAALGGLTGVYSHVHALGQCRKIIRQLRLAAVTAGDTAGAAREIAEWSDPTKAALAPKLAAEIYGLDILARKRRGRGAQHHALRGARARPRNGPAQATAPMMTTFIFRVRNVPAALYKALGGFATNGVNMTKLESYMVDGEFAATQFLADVEGHPEDPPLALALEELAFFSREVRDSRRLSREPVPKDQYPRLRTIAIESPAPGGDHVRRL